MFADCGSPDGSGGLVKGSVVENLSQGRCLSPDFATMSLSYPAFLPTRRVLPNRRDLPIPIELK